MAQSLVTPITTSVFELYKIGPGPSSSHTIGPMLAALDFRRQLEALPAERKEKAGFLRVRLFGSLSATGEGHGTDMAVLTGLLGHEPAHSGTDIQQNRHSADD